MANFYETLGITPTASTTEIQSAYDSKYDQWRRLVNHHDQQIVLQAQQALQSLEMIRGTLLDQSKRAAYDAGIGLNGPIGGLADPAALLRTLSPVAAPTPPAPHAVATVPAAPPRSTSLWTCPKCQADNPASTKFCFKCGTQLVRTCPECKQESSLIATGMCGNCGYGHTVATRREELRSLLRVIGEKLKSSLPQLQLARENSRRTAGVIWGGIILACGVIIFLGGLGGNQSALGWGFIVGVVGLLGLVGGQRYQNRWKATAGTLSQTCQTLQNEQSQLQSEFASTELRRS